MTTNQYTDIPELQWNFSDLTLGSIGRSGVLFPRA